MNLKKRIDITRRGYTILNTYIPGLIRAKAISAIIEALTPFVTIWFSARIINEMARERSANALIFYVLMIIGIHFAFSMTKNVMDRIVDEKEAGMWNYFRKVFSDKQMSMDYVDLEDLDIKNYNKRPKKTYLCSETDWDNLFGEQQIWLELRWELLLLFH